MKLTSWTHYQMFSVLDNHCSWCTNKWQNKHWWPSNCTWIHKLNWPKLFYLQVAPDLPALHCLYIVKFCRIAQNKHIDMCQNNVFSLDGHVHLYLRVGLVVADNEVFVNKVINVRHFPLELQLGKWPWLTFKLHIKWTTTKITTHQLT